MKALKYNKGELICKENSPGDSMYLMLSGRIRIYKTIDAEKVELAVMEKDDFFGELCLLLECPRTATAEAMEKTEVLSITRETLLQKIQEDPRFAENMIKTMAKRLTEAHRVISSLEGEKRSLEIMYGVK